jgi:hypothetical protein
MTEQIAPQSEAQKELTGIVAQDPAKAQALYNWLSTQKLLLFDDSDAAMVNASILLTELRGREVNDKNIHDAIGRNAYSGHRKLTFVPTPEQDRTIVIGKKNWAAVKTEEVKPTEPQIEYVHGRKNHASVPEPKPVDAPKPKVDAWETIARNAAKAHSHGVTAQLEAVITRGINEGKQWREIAREVQTARKVYDSRTAVR